MAIALELRSLIMYRQVYAFRNDRYWCALFVGEQWMIENEMEAKVTEMLGNKFGVSMSVIIEPSFVDVWQDVPVCQGTFDLVSGL